ncbi:hypothetical protein CO663_25210 [Rhizobium anhuiense]|nr:hypothetical protein CO663_25210 [Rhizobium anhuiense]
MTIAIRLYLPLRFAGVRDRRKSPADQPDSAKEMPFNGHNCRRLSSHFGYPELGLMLVVRR